VTAVVSPARRGPHGWAREVRCPVHGVWSYPADADGAIARSLDEHADCRPVVVGRRPRPKVRPKVRREALR
jgi:hypothetical protein